MNPSTSTPEAAGSISPAKSLDDIKSNMLLGYRLEVDHKKKLVRLHRTGDGRTKAVEYGLAVAVLPRLREDHPRCVVEAGVPDGDDIAVREGIGRPLVPKNSSDASSESPASGANGQAARDDASEPPVLAKAWYTVQELAELTGLSSKSFSQLFRSVESQGQRPNKQYRTGRALLKKLADLGADVRLDGAFEAVEGKPTATTKKTVVKKAAKKRTAGRVGTGIRPAVPTRAKSLRPSGALSAAKPESTPKIESIDQAEAKTTTEVAEREAQPGLGDGVEMTPPAGGVAFPGSMDSTGNDDSVLPPLDDTVIEHLACQAEHRLAEVLAIEQISKAKAYAGLLYDLLCRDEETRMVHQYLAGDAEALLGNVLGMVRPPMRVKDQAA